MVKKNLLVINCIFMTLLCGCSAFGDLDEGQINSETEASYCEFDADEAEDDGKAAEATDKKNSDASDGKDNAALSISESSSSATDASSEKTGLLTDASDINLRDTDGKGKNYLFTYNNEDYSAVYTTDNWKIYDSYKITNMDDITLICEALSAVHQIHGSDMESYRTPDDMAYEWLQHNLAYQFLSDDNPWKVHAQNVDLDPKDQGKSFDEIYEDRTGKQFNLEDFFDIP